MAEGKWITDLPPTTPLADAARRVLTVRLQIVHDYLPLALHQWKEDVEHVHQLRVGTRRAGAALTIFEPCLPAKVHKRIRKHLRNIRRAAGDARDWDVFAEALAEREAKTTEAQRHGLDYLIGYCQGQRLAAQVALEAASPDAPFGYERLVGETLAELRPGSNGAAATLGQHARPVVGSLLQQLHAAACVNLDQYEHLHQVRILGKQLRYAMEVFGSCFGDDFKDKYYPQVEHMQDILGLANDSHVAAGRLSMLRDWLKPAQPAVWKRFRAGIEGLLRYHQRRLPDQRRLFLKWWARWRESGAETALTGLVARAG
jgi:CHAD domain-containing protein